MKILFFGTSKFAVPALRKLTEGDFKVVGVVTQPDRPVGRKQILSPTPVKKIAMQNDLPVFDPEKLDIKTWESEMPEADLYAVASYGNIIPKEIIDQPEYGSLNIHPSLLPIYRGPSPIQTAILNGDRETGVSIIKMDEKMDHGAIIANSKFEIRNSMIYYQDLHDKLADLGADLLIKTIPKYVSGSIQPTPQDHDKATYTQLIKKADGKINWTDSAVETERKIRAYHKWPTAWTTVDDKRLKIFKAVAVDVKHPGYEPGTVISTSPTLRIKCGSNDGDGSGVLVIEELQLEGKKKMSAKQFTRGYDIEAKVFK